MVMTIVEQFVMVIMVLVHARRSKGDGDGYGGSALGVADDGVR